MSESPYRGRFAPSPTGLLHAGSLVAALASWLDARSHGGTWLVRVEDVDMPRCVPGADRRILQQLADCGLLPDEPPVWQSQRTALYQLALDRLTSAGLAYPCGCSRKDIESVLQASGMGKPRNGEMVYPRTCREGLHGKPTRAWRLNTAVTQEKLPVAPAQYAQEAMNSVAITSPRVCWTDRRLGPQTQDVPQEVGDFVLLRADGLFAYQLAVVVDDAEQGITHVVRGEDLADNTARQILLQGALELPTPHYLHTPLVLGANGEKLSKQNGAQALETDTPQAALEALSLAAQTLGLTAATANTMSQALAIWTQEWRAQWSTTEAIAPR